MSKKEIPDSAIEIIAKHINARSNKPYQIPIVGIPDNVETPQYFEIYPFDQKNIQRDGFELLTEAITVKSFTTD